MVCDLVCNAFDMRPALNCGNGINETNLIISRYCKIYFLSLSIELKCLQSYLVEQLIVGD